jgi:hypothetical protein
VKAKLLPRIHNVNRMLLNTPAKHVAAFTAVKITAPPLSTQSAFYSHAVFRFCGLTRCLRLTSPARLVPLLIYIPTRGFEGRVILTSTVGFAHHNRAVLIQVVSVHVLSRTVQKRPKILLIVELPTFVDLSTVCHIPQQVSSNYVDAC